MLILFILLFIVFITISLSGIGYLLFQLWVNQVFDVELVTIVVGSSVLAAALWFWVKLIRQKGLIKAAGSSIRGKSQETKTSLRRF